MYNRKWLLQISQKLIDKFLRNPATEKQTDGQIPSTSQPPPCFADARNSVDSKKPSS